MSEEKQTLPEMNEIEREICEHRERFKSIFAGGFGPVGKYAYARVAQHNPWNWSELDGMVYIVTGYSLHNQEFYAEIVVRNEFVKTVSENMKRTMV